MEEIDGSVDEALLKGVERIPVIDEPRLAVPSKVGARSAIDEVPAKRPINAVRQALSRHGPLVDRIEHRGERNPAIGKRAQEIGPHRQRG